MSLLEILLQKNKPVNWVLRVMHFVLGWLAVSVVCFDKVKTITYITTLFWNQLPQEWYECLNQFAQEDPTNGFILALMSFITALCSIYPRKWCQWIFKNELYRKDEHEHAIATIERVTKNIIDVILFLKVNVIFMECYTSGPVSLHWPNNNINTVLAIAVRFVIMFLDYTT